jgi:predicted ABC-type ATPase
MVVVIGGPNGAGKTTISREVLSNTLGLTEFVNADAIAQGLSGFDPDRAAFAAGRIMLTRLKELAAARASFAFESTLSSKTLVPWLDSLKASGYEVHVLYVSLATASLAVRRVRQRVQRGGHDVPESTVRRRFGRSLLNFFAGYSPIATTWHLFDNSEADLRLIAWQARPGTMSVLDAVTFQRLQDLADADPNQDDDRE